MRPRQARHVAHPLVLGAALLPLAPTGFLKPLLGGVLATSAAKLLRKTRPRPLPPA